MRRPGTAAHHARSLSENGDTKLHATTPATLTDALEAMARAELDEAAPVPAITRAVEALTPHLPAEKRDLWWWELKHCLTRAAAAEGGPAWDERDIDWNDRAKEAVNVLAGLD